MKNAILVIACLFVWGTSYSQKYIGYTYNDIKKEFGKIRGKNDKVPAIVFRKDANYIFYFDARSHSVVSYVMQLSNDNFKSLKNDLNTNDVIVEKDKKWSCARLHQSVIAEIISETKMSSSIKYELAAN